MLFSLTPPPARAAGFSQDTFQAEDAKLAQQRSAWHDFSQVAFHWLLAAFALVAVVAMIRFAANGFAALAVAAVICFCTFAAMDVVPYRSRESLLLLGMEVQEVF